MEIVVVRKSRLVLTNLMEGILTRLDTMPEMDPTQDESLDDKTRRLAKKDWYSSNFGSSSNPMERLAKILEVTDNGEKTDLAIIAPMISVFAPQGTPSVATPSLLVPQSRPMVTPIAPISTQFGAGNIT